MFVIAHIPPNSKIPSYFWKVDSSGHPCICMDLKSAEKFYTFKDARAKLDSLSIGTFAFEIKELVIKGL